MLRGNESSRGNLPHHVRVILDGLVPKIHFFLPLWTGSQTRLLQAHGSILRWILLRRQQKQFRLGERPFSLVNQAAAQGVPGGSIGGYQQRPKL